MCVCVCVCVYDGWWSCFLTLILKLSLINPDHSPSPSWFLQDTYSCPVSSVTLQVPQGQWLMLSTLHLSCGTEHIVITQKILLVHFPQWGRCPFPSISSRPWTLNRDSPLIFKVDFHTERCTFPWTCAWALHFCQGSFSSEEVREEVLVSSWEFFEKNYVGEIT